MEDIEMFLNSKEVEDLSLLEESIQNVEEDQGDEDLIVQGYSQWNVTGENFYPTYPTYSTIPSGQYKIRYDTNTNFYLSRKEITSNDLIIFKDNIISEILKEVHSFWTSKEKYKSLNYSYKRGIMLYGATGNGKSYIVDLLSILTIEQFNGIVIFLDNNDSIYDFNKIVSIIKEIEKDRKIMIVLENIDIICSDKGLYLTLLDILDGKTHNNDLLFVGTTNFNEKIEDTILNRPGRFNKWFEISSLNKESRKEFFIQSLTPEFIATYTIDKLIEDTIDFNIDWLKELITSIAIFDNDYETSIQNIKKSMHNKPVVPNNNGKKIGPQFK